MEQAGEERSGKVTEAAREGQGEGAEKFYLDKGNVGSRQSRHFERSRVDRVGQGETDGAISVGSEGWG